MPQPFTSATHDDANRLVQKGAAALAYDAAGNLVSDGANAYAWNARNQLTAISGSVSASFRYDAFGRRVSKTVNSQTTSYLYDGAAVVQESTAGMPAANMLTGGDDSVFTRSDAGPCVTRAAAAAWFEPGARGVISYSSRERT